MAMNERHAGQRLTIEEFEHLPEDEFYRYELDRGMLVREPPPGTAHGLVTVAIAYYLRRYAETHGGAVTAESGYVLSEAEHTVRGPDVAWVRPDRIGYGLPEGYIRSAPDLAVEIVSPSNEERALAHKIRQYLEAGSTEVWLLRPRTRSVEVHRRGAEPRLLSHADTLEGGDLLPGFSEPVAAFFR